MITGLKFKASDITYFILILNALLCFLLKYLNYCVGALPLPWSIRMKIALGAAKGLAFLHEEATKTVIYRDFKTSNILLDAVGATYTYLPIFTWLQNYQYSNDPLQYRNTMLSFLTLVLRKMVQREIKLMYLPV